MRSFSSRRPTRHSRSRTRAGIFAALIALLATLPGLWVGTLWDNSETAYAEVAREVLRTHDSIVMHFNGVAWFVQPPLFFWIAALCAHIFGVTTFAMRLPAMLATIAMGFGIAVFCTHVAGTRAARYTGLILSTMLMQAIIGRLAIMDALLDATIMITVLAWARSTLKEGTRDERGSQLITGAIAAALGFLTKGLVAIAIPLMILVPWMLYEGRLGRLSRPPRSAMVLAACAGLAIIGPWLALFSVNAGPQGLNEFFLHYTFGRYTGVIENQTGPWFYYLPVFLFAVFPWSGALIMALVYAFGQRSFLLHDTGLRATALRLSLCWITIPLIFFSCAQTKLPNYIALVLPGAALLIGLWLDEQLASRRRRALGAFVSVPIFALLLLGAMILFAQHNTLDTALKALWPYAIAFVSSIFLGALLALVMLRQRSLARNAPLVLGSTTLISMMIVACFALPVAERFKPIPPLAAYIREHYHSGDTVAIQGVNGQNALMYYTRPPLLVLDSESSAERRPST